MMAKQIPATSKKLDFKIKKKSFEKKKFHFQLQSTFL